MPDHFQAFIDQDRCASRGDGRRCQLFDAHAGDHAAAWSDPVPLSFYRRGSGRVAPKHWLRWDNAGATREQEPGTERLRWACMGAP